jgi:hypothetical protein
MNVTRRAKRCANCGALPEIDAPRAAAVREGDSLCAVAVNA